MLSSDSIEKISNLTTVVMRLTSNTMHPFLISSLLCFLHSTEGFQTFNSFSTIRASKKIERFSHPQISVSKLRPAPFGKAGPRMSVSVLTSQQIQTQAKESPPSSTIVVGGGPAGLSTAIMLAKRGWKGIKVLERLPRIPRSDDYQFWQDPERSYNIGLNGKGQAVLRSLGCWDRIDACCADVVGRMDWVPESDEPNEVLLAEKRGYVTKVIQRDRLVSCLYEELQVHCRPRVPSPATLTQGAGEVQKPGRGRLQQRVRQSAVGRRPGGEDRALRP